MQSNTAASAVSCSKAACKAAGSRLTGHAGAHQPQRMHGNGDSAGALETQNVVASTTASTGAGRPAKTPPIRSGGTRPSFASGVPMRSHRSSSPTVTSRRRSGLPRRTASKTANSVATLNTTAPTSVGRPSAGTARPSTCAVRRLSSPSGKPGRASTAGAGRPLPGGTAITVRPAPRQSPTTRKPPATSAKCRRSNARSAPAPDSLAMPLPITVSAPLALASRSFRAVG